MRQLSRLFCVVVVLLPSALRAEAPLTGRVTRVIDADTIQVGEQTIRLEGIDSPELGQAFGPKAKEVLSSKVLARLVTVKPNGKDKYGRTLGIVWIDSRNINSELVEEGWAWHFRKYSKDQALADAEKVARENNIGLWADPKPISPWDWRDAEKARRLAGEAPRLTADPSVPATKAAARATPVPSTARTLPKPTRSAPKASLQQQADDPDFSPAKSGTVFITKTGNKYHSAGCSSLSKSKIPISLEEAKAKGYTPCSKCGGIHLEENPAETSIMPSDSPSGATPTGKTIYTGPRGGRYHISKSGKKVYERRK